VISRLANDKPIEATEPHADLLMAAHELMASCGYQIDLMFVHSHQDDGSPTVLSQEAWMNIKADLLAKKKALTLYIGPICYKLPGNPWGCYANNKQVIKQLNAALRIAINGRETMAY